MTVGVIVCVCARARPLNIDARQILKGQNPLHLLGSGDQKRRLHLRPDGAQCWHGGKAHILVRTWVRLGELCGGSGATTLRINGGGAVTAQARFTSVA